jgi:hypothetical protein
MMKAVGLEPDIWQAGVLRSTAERVLMLCARQSGKSTTAAALAIHTAVYQPDSLVLLVSPTQRQSGELFKKVTRFYALLRRPVPGSETATTLTLANRSRVVSLPGSAETLRGYSAPRLVVADEAARVTDETFVALAPMLALGGRLVAVSTPMGKRGWFHAAYTDPRQGYERVRVTADDIDRISPAFLAAERQRLGDRWYAQEYKCEFVDVAGQCFDTASVLRSFVDAPPPLSLGAL